MSARSHLRGTGVTRLSDEIRSDTGWDVVEDRHVAERAVTIGSNFLVGNGYLGYRGTRPDQTAHDFVACTVSDTYDMADGRWRELCNVPNGLFAEFCLDGLPLRSEPDTPAEVRLDLRDGVHDQRSVWRTPAGARADVSFRRFSSLDDLHLLVQEVTVVPEADGTLEVAAGIDARVWDLNGPHLVEGSFAVEDELLVHRSTTIERGTGIVVAAEVRVDDDPHGIWFEEPDHDRLVRRWTVSATAGSPITVRTFAAVSTTNDGSDPDGVVRASIARALASGVEAERSASHERWTEFWDRADVRIEGDQAAQAALRFCLYHNRIATPAHSDRLPVGARGLSCQAYQGAAFWDQEIFNLPAFLFTEPDVARRLLVYRWRTLDGARRKAEDLGYTGAFYAWISGDTGDELCPDFFFVDTISGRPIRNHFNDWQMHVSPDIAYTVWRYWKVTADWDFMVDHGAEILFEVARFLHSFVVYNEFRQRYECRRLLGPDEWHENVDNDAFTNHMVRTALDHALTAVQLFTLRDPDALAALRTRIGLTDDEIVAWERVRDGLYLPEPDPETLLIEQFDGFSDLEDCRPEDLVERLVDDGEYWGWPNGVAVFTQVSKQPAVVQLFHLDHTFPVEVQRANYDFYEPRCAHGSSLSHSVHALVAARLGELDEAYRYFWRTATIDLLSTSKAVVGGTFIGGIHTAACGGAYQVAAFGFGGLDALEGVLHLAPRLPARWDALEFSAVLRGQLVRIRATHEQVSITADPDNTAPVPIRVHDGPEHQIRPAEVLTVHTTDSDHHDTATHPGAPTGRG